MAWSSIFSFSEHKNSKFNVWKNQMAMKELDYLYILK